MSVPARQLLREPAVPVPAPRGDAARPRTSFPPQAPRGARRRPATAFWVLTAMVVTLLVVGVVSISALLVKASFQAEALEVRLGELYDEQEVLAREVAVLSSPSRVQSWARMHGLDRPDQTPIILRLPPEGEPAQG